MHLSGTNIPPSKYLGYEAFGLGDDLIDFSTCLVYGHIPRSTQEREWDQACTAFFQSFKSYDEAGDPERLQVCLLSVGPIDG